LNKNTNILFLSFTILLLLTACKKDTNVLTENSKALFTSIPASYSSVNFNNRLTFTEEYNPYTFKNFLNGGGVALGDINNDNLVDIYFTGNLVENKMYLNKGNFQFEDITKNAGLACAGNWSTGASFVDINHDGLLDVFVCKSGKPEGENRYNQFFLNNGDLTFTDQTKEFGMDFIGLSIHAAFFDYDKDGDLDCYLLNNSIRSVGAYDIVEGLRDRPDEKGGNKLLRNMEVETGSIRFEDVSQAAGIYTSAIGFGLGVSVADLNGDHWEDIFVSNDFFERDYLYVNQKDGTFKEVVTSSISELSMGSMGADIADINNDMRPDIFVTEMLPEKLNRYKSKAVFESYDKSKLNRSKGYHNQFGRNVLQYNTGNNKGIPQFLELGRYHGVEATDWSWGALMADFDNNGLKDIFVANGIAKDLLDLDHIAFYNPQKIGAMVKEGRKDVITTIIESFPKEKLANYLFIQDSLNHFEKTYLSGIDEPNFANGSAYADLDNDGDLDLVLNLIDETSRIYKNNSKNNSFCQVTLTGSEKNTKAIGSKVALFADGNSYYLDLHPMRGYQSSVDYKLHFGLGQSKKVDSLKVVWPDQRVSAYYDLKVDSSYHFQLKGAKQTNIAFATNNKNATTLLQKQKGMLNYVHKENRFSDFDQNRMLLQMMSNEGPKAQVADLNKDGQSELLITGSSGSACSYFELKGNKFQQKEIPLFKAFEQSETCNFIITDFNKDNKEDILLLNGGVEFPAVSSALRDQLLVNKMNNFVKSENGFNSGFTSSSCGIAIDIDQDGAKEIVIGSRLELTAYGVPSSGAVYKKVNGKYIKAPLLNKALQGIGMIKDIRAADLNGNGQQEIIFSREYNSLAVFEYEYEKGLVENTNTGLEKVKGIWNDIEIVDIDQDGDQDIIAANLGLNQRFKNLSKGSLYLFVNDFDANGRVEAIHCVKEGDQYFPIHLKKELLSQLPILKKKVLKYEVYAKASMMDLFGAERLSKSIVHEVNEYRSGVFVNNGGTFSFLPLPEEVQYSEQRAIWSGDLNNDGFPDLIMGGNQYETKPEIGMNAASYGHVLMNQKNGKFAILPHEESGFFERGQIRDIVEVKIKGEQYIIVLKNGGAAGVYRNALFQKGTR
jgi:hypothetical protein